MRKLSNLLMVFGIVAFVVATAWWFIFFHEVLGDEFQLARECFYWTTNLCSLKAPAGLFVEIPEYQPMLLWIASGLFGAGLVARIWGATH